jgi:flagella basal body P-ring formation protein FlgA
MVGTMLVAMAAATPAGAAPKAPAAAPAPGRGAGHVVRLYLPRSVSVTGDTLRLGQITVVRCDDESLTAKVSAIPMGRAPSPAEKIAFGREIILGRLAVHGVRAERVRLTGADTIAVVGQGQLIPAAEIVARAEQFLKDSRIIPASQRWRVARKPQDMVLSRRGKVTLTPELADHSPADHVLVLVRATRGTARVGTAKVLFRRIYPASRAVATREITPGQAVTPANARVETIMTDSRPDANWSAPYGMVATRRIAAGSVVHTGAVRRKRQPVVVRRNQNVIMRIAGPGFSITATGLALQDGKVGESIRVRNVDSKRVITAHVNADGTVEPSFEEARR